MAHVERSTGHLRVTREINAPAKIAYEVLADYNDHHPRILPSPPFDALEVLQGGRGDGTRVRVTGTFLGVTTTLEMVVTEPEPGRILQEHDEAAGVTTRFEVTPMDERRCTVTLDTTWAVRPGLRNWVERRLNPRAAKGIYERELDLLEAYARDVHGERA